MSEWIQEEAKEKERMLYDRWSVLERDLPVGSKCSERIEHELELAREAEEAREAEAARLARRALQAQLLADRRARKQAATAGGRESGPASMAAEASEAADELGMPPTAPPTQGQHPVPAARPRRTPPLLTPDASASAEQLHTALAALDRDAAGGRGSGLQANIDASDPVEVAAAQFKEEVARMAVNKGDGFVLTFEELQLADRRTFVPSACSEGAKLYNKPLNRYEADIDDPIHFGFRQLEDTAGCADLHSNSVLSVW